MCRVVSTAGSMTAQTAKASCTGAVVAPAIGWVAL
jgi:hypothetical protein